VRRRPEPPAIRDGLVDYDEKRADDLADAEESEIYGCAYCCDHG
jgi:hypothetical protein